MTDWMARSAAASLASHRLVGWIFWDPDAIARFAALGPDPGLYYVASRAAPLAPAGPGAVAAAFYSIHEDFIRIAIELTGQHTTWDAVYEARNAAVGAGLRTYAPEIVDHLTSLRDDLWQAADSLPLSGRVLFAAHRDAPRAPEDDLVSAWLAVNCIREWRGDTHWAILAAEDIDGVQAGILHNAHLDYPEDWIPRSRGADDAALDEAYAALAARGLAAGRTVTEAGLALRQDVEDRTDRQAERAWRHLGDETTDRFVSLLEPVGERLLERVDQTAGEHWMPAGRTRGDGAP